VTGAPRRADRPAEATTPGLPDFLIVGAPKSGTTSLYRYLSAHPELYLSPVKEPRYFAFPDTPPRFVGPGSGDLNREIIWRRGEYERLFAGREPHQRMAGEASATYLWAPGTAERIASAIPDVRIVAILRQPADRAFSHFCHNRRLHREPLARFEDALAAEPERRRRGWSFNLLYTDRGRYGTQLTEYHRALDPAQVLVLLYDDLVSDASRTTKRVCAHLGVSDDVELDTSRRYNVAHGRPRSIRLHRLLTGRTRTNLALRRVLPRTAYNLIASRNIAPLPTFGPAERDRLTESFADDLALLETVIDRDLSHWLAPTRRGL
jgi:Sulfotransferase family